MYQIVINILPNLIAFISQQQLSRPNIVNARFSSMSEGAISIILSCHFEQLLISSPPTFLSLHFQPSPNHPRSITSLPVAPPNGFPTGVVVARNQLLTEFHSQQPPASQQPKGTRGSVGRESNDESACGHSAQSLYCKCILLNSRQRRKSMCYIY